jgi:hypothetical protein
MTLVVRMGSEYYAQIVYHGDRRCWCEIGHCGHISASGDLRASYLSTAGDIVRSIGRSVDNFDVTRGEYYLVFGVALLAVDW